MKNEPVMTLIVALIVAAGGLLAAFGVNVTDEQIAALSAFAVAALGLGVWVRSKVAPTTKGLTMYRARSDRGQVEPLTLLVYVIVFVILLVVLFKVLDRL
jgi:uncharacterized membrane protein